MMRVLITQRVDVVESYGERRDALDQAWFDTLERLAGRSVVLMPLPTLCPTPAAFAPELIVLTGGNDIGSAPDRDAAETAVLDFAMAMRLPVLAVCRGMQMMHSHAGGVLQKVDSHVGAVHDVTVAAREPGPRNLTVNSFHGYGISASSMVPTFEPLCTHRDGTVEGMRHVELPWIAVMWHPERSGPDDQANAWLANRLRQLF